MRTSCLRRASFGFWGPCIVFRGNNLIKEELTWCVTNVGNMTMAMVGSRGRDGLKMLAAVGR